MKDVHLEDVIRLNVPLPPHPNGRGFYSVVCKVCNDHGKKGPRAGFKFGDEAVGYNCFNCGHKALYDPNDPEHSTISESMIKVLDGFGIPERDWQQVQFATMSGNKGLKVKKRDPLKEIEPPEVELPKGCYKLENDQDDKWTVIARDYLEYERGIDPDSYPFYLYKGSDKKWKGRLIIPIYKDDKLIYFQGRSLVTMSRKYMSPSLPKDRVIFGFDKIFRQNDAPLYVVEGFFDAMSINGVAVFGNQMTPEQIRWLSRSSRPKIIIPDRFGDGHLLANQAIKLDWGVAFPEIGSCKDMNDAVRRFGILYVMKSIAETACKGFAAQTAAGIYCGN